MKPQFENLKPTLRPQLMGTTRLGVCLLSVGALLMTASLAHGAKIRGIIVPGTVQPLPPFIPLEAPQPSLPAVTPFEIVGFIQSATVDTPCTATACADFFVGGWVEINNQRIRVPRNTMFQMPATAMTWSDMFKNAPAGYLALGQSGLAITDGTVGSLTAPKPPFTTYEVHVQGNRVVNPNGAVGSTDLYIAGLIYISQQAGTLGMGYVNAIDYSTCAARVPALAAPVPPATVAGCMPDIWIGQTLAAKTGSRVRLNTPHNVYGAADPSADPRFTSDEGNPTVVARTGYPVCVPRFDPATGTDSLCPQWNRPKDTFTGAYSVNYTFPAAAGGLPDANGVTHQAGNNLTGPPPIVPDPFEQTPIEVGDYVSYTGNLVQDNQVACVVGGPISNCQYIAAHTFVAELGLYTAPSTWPVYMFMSDFKFGVGGTPNPIFPQEAVEKIFGDFFSTDFSQLVDVYSEDVNSTTGATSHRFYGSSDPFGPPLGGLKGRARFRVTVGNFLPPTRNMAVASRALTGGAPVDTILATAKKSANGLTSGFYTAPQFAYIFPENLVLGSPQIPLNFQEFPFLVNGSGPYCLWPAAAVPATATTAATCDNGTAPAGILGQLNPWPGLTAPPQLLNSTGLTLLQPPVANAGAPQNVASGATVTLNASGSVDPNVPALPMVYTWQQLTGPPVGLLQVNNMQPLQTFAAPALAAGAAPVVLTFQLAVCNGFTCGGAVNTSVTVTAAAPPAPPAPAVSLAVSSVVNATTKQTTITLTASCGAATTCAPVFTQTAGAPLRALTGTGATRTFTVTSTTPQPPATFKATVGTASATVGVFDTITVVNVVYQLAHSKLQVSCNTTALPKGTAVMTVTPLVNNKVTGPDVVMTYDPVLDSYNLLADIVNPIPDGVNIRSSYGGLVLNSPVTRVR